MNTGPLTHDTFCGIADYGVIGDGRSAALISKTGSLDWLCWPYFQSPSAFAALLDQEKGGRWQICPSGEFTVSRKYLGHTAILETTFTTQKGVLTLTDFMPVAEEAYLRASLWPEREVLRIARCTQGRVDMQLRYQPRPDYAKSEKPLRNRGALGVRISHGRGNLTLHSPRALAIQNNQASANWTMSQNEEMVFSLTFGTESPEIIPFPGEAAEKGARTRAWWENWMTSFSYQGPHRDQVARSAITLKLLEFPSTGAVIAAVTTSLPERVGGPLNWDYRYCWLRDASWTIESFWAAGFHAEAENFAEWLMHATRLTQPNLMVVYDVYGRVTQKECSLDSLQGFRGSSPVRVGNGARHQVQLDLYGEVIGGAAIILRGTRLADRDTNKILNGFGLYICKHWQDPDAGIWELREAPKIHTHSLLLGWKGLDDLIALHEERLLSNGPVERFRQTRASIRKKIEEDCWNPALQSYVDSPGSDTVDASLLLLGTRGFDPPRSARMQSTYAQIQKTLGAGAGLLYRYIPKTESEGAFGLCGFWAVEFLAMGGGSLEDAQKLLDTLAAYPNDLGLYSEEIDPASGEALGNFPQAFTHIGSINAALAVHQRIIKKEN